MDADMQRNLPLLLLSVLLFGCAGSGTPYEPPVNNRDIVLVKTAFEQISNGTSIRLQGGQRIADGNLDRWTTWCRLYVYNRRYEADYVTSVQPAEFEIVSVRVRYQSSDLPYRPRDYWNHYRFHSLPAYYEYEVGMRLASTDQPDVQSLDCYKKWATRGRHYPTYGEIRQALGDQIEIRPLP